MKEHLINLGFKNELPHQFVNDSYFIIEVSTDSYNFPLWTIFNRRYDEAVFRGRLRSIEDFNFIFSLVKEDYDLTYKEVDQLKK